MIEVDTSGFEPLTVVSNTYSGGKGVLKLSGEITVLSYGMAQSPTLKSVILPNSVTTIGDSAFYETTSLTNITISNNVARIGEDAFYGCTGLTSVDIPDNVITIGNNAFYGCNGLSSVTLGNNVTTINSNVFINCNLSRIVVNSGNTKYDSRDNCNAIIETATNTLVIGCKNTVIPNTVTTIGKAAFRNQTSLTDITIPNSVTTIDRTAFDSCRGLVTFTVPNTVTNIGIQAFNNIPNVIYSGSATGSPWGASAVNGCIDGDFVYTDNTKAHLVDYIGNSGSVIIPDNVTEASSSTFSHTTITSIVLGNGLTSIPFYFGENKNLTSIVIGNSITRIEDGAFYECTNLSSVIIGNGVKIIVGGAFIRCISLTSITIPANVESIGDYAFHGCSGLTSITCNATNPPTLDICAFDETNNCPIYVPSGSVEAYKAATNWSTYADRIQAIQ